MGLRPLGELLGGDAEVLGRLVVIWTPDRTGDGTEYRVVADGIAEDDPRWVAGELRRIAYQLELAGGWTKYDAGPADNEPKRRVITVRDGG